MSISNTLNQVFGQGDGVTTIFTFPFKIFKTTDLKVYLINTSVTPNTSVLQTLTTNYSVVINPVAEGGSVTFTVAPPVGQVWLFSRQEPFTQSVVLAVEGALPAQQISNQLDLMTMLCIQMNQLIGQCIQVQTPFIGSVPLTLPAPSPSTVFAWDAAGTAIINIPINNGGQVVPNGVLKGSSGNLVTAVSGTDYGRPMFLNVKDFGATGNGTTDDTAAIQAAITAIGTSGGTVFLPAGNYKISSTLTWSTKPVYLVGEGSGFGPGVGTRITVAAGVVGINPQYGAGGLGQRSRIEHLNLTGSDSSAGTNDGILCEANGTYISDVVVQSFGHFGIHVYSGVYNANVVRLNHIFCYLNYTGGVYFDGGNTNACVITGLECVNNLGYGVVCDNAANSNQFYGVELEGNSLGGIHLKAALGNFFSGIYYESDNNYALTMEAGASYNYAAFSQVGSYLATYILDLGNGNNYYSYNLIRLNGSLTLNNAAATVTPATTGTVQVPTIFALGAPGNAVLYSGFLPSNAFWLQNSNPGALGVNYGLLLNPNGGIVGVGTLTPEAPFDSPVGNRLASVRTMPGAVVTNTGSTLTLSAANMVKNAIFQQTGTTAPTFTLDTGTALSAAIPGTVQVGDCVSFVVSNASNQTITMAGATGTTLANAMTVATLQSRTFYAINTGTNTWTIY